MKPLPSLLSASTALLQLSVSVTAKLLSNDSSQSEHAFPFSDYEPSHGGSLIRRADDLVALRIMPLGASIVEGVGSDPEHNGFRGALRQALRHNGFPVDMVGSKHEGTIEDDDNEGHPGDHISHTLGNFNLSKLLKPNVVVINVGTNDANGNDDIPGAKQRMKDVLTGIWKAEDMLDACVILSTLIPTPNAAHLKNNDILNDYYRQLVSELEGSHCIYLAEMDPPSIRPRWILPDIQPDTIHPNKEGHRKMAYVFWQSIIRAYNDGKIKPPVEVDENPAMKSCNKEYNSGTYAGLTQLGSGYDDGIYYHNSEYKGIVWNRTTDHDQGQFFFAALYGRERDDLVGWYENDNAPYYNAFGVWKNMGGGKFEKIEDLHPDLHCLPQGITFVDMNSDGLDDLVCVDPDGNVYLSINKGHGTDSKPPTFERVSDTAKIRDNVGFKQNRIRIADIDGDGRGDYLAIDDSGNIQAWRNGWVDDNPKYWQSLGQRFNAKGKGNITGVHMLDLNGDGRADWLWVSDVGEVETWTNSRTCQSGKDGDGLKVDWRQGFALGASSGYTHAGVAQFDPKGDIRTRIMFGRIWGEPQDFGNFGRKDYAYLEHSEDEDGKHHFQMRAWKNIGHGGTKVKADGVKYCNMLGHNPPREDYVWTWSDGKMIMFPNIGKNKVGPGESYWGPVVTIFDPENMSIGKKLDRRDLHLMDWDGDGDCDIVWTDPDNDNKPSVWINLYHTTESWSSPKTWDYFPNAQSSASGVSCKETRGFDLHDQAVQFADIDGNGRDDYLCIRPDGHITGFIHKDDNSWVDVQQIKFAQDKDRANLRFADVNGDGFDDMLWVDKFNGDGFVWYNRGPGDRSQLDGSYIHWERHTKAVYNSDRAGTCVYFPDLDGNGNADIHVIRDVYSNKAATWYSPSCFVENHHGDGGSCCDDPNLPVQPGTTPIGPGDNGLGQGSGVVYINPDVWNHHTAQCEDPCVLVWPPSQLPGVSTFTIPAYTTSLEVRSTTTTITLHPPPIVTNQVPMSNQPITPGEDPTVLQPLPSITLPETEWVLTFVTDGGKTTSTTRAIVYPPWPQITMGPVEGWGEWSATAIPPPVSSSSTDVIFPPIPHPSSTVTDYGVIIPVSTTEPPIEPSDPPQTWTDWPPVLIEPVTMKIDDTQVVEDDDDEHDGLGAFVRCDLWFFNLCLDLPKLPKIRGWHWRFPPGIIGPGPPPWWDIKFDNWEIEGDLAPWPKITIGPDQKPTFPSEPDVPCESREATICPIATTLNDGTTTKVTYAYDISTCIKFTNCYATDYEPSTSRDVCSIDNEAVNRLATVTASGSGGDATTKTATSTATSSVTKGAAPGSSRTSPETSRPTATTSLSATLVDSASVVQDKASSDQGDTQGHDTHRTADTALGQVSGSSLSESFAKPKRQINIPNPFSGHVDENDPANWKGDGKCDKDPVDRVCYPAQRTNDASLQLIRNRLSGTGLHWVEIRAETAGYTAFFFVEKMPIGLQDKFNRMTGNIAECYTRLMPAQAKQAAREVAKSNSPREVFQTNITTGDDIKRDTHIQKRAAAGETGISWALSQLAWPFHPGENPFEVGKTWANDPYAQSNYIDPSNPSVPHYNYWNDDSRGAGQYIYIVDSGNEIGNHPEFQGLKNKPILLPGKAWGNSLQTGDLHGAKVGALAGGHRFGMANNAQLLFTETVNPVGFGGEHYLEGLLVVLEDMTKNPDRQFKSVINMSWGANRAASPVALGQAIREILERIDKLGGLPVVAGGNWGNARISGDDYPHYFVSRIPNMILVGATSQNGQRWAQSTSYSGRALYAYAPGDLVLVPTIDPGTGALSTNWESGTSYAAPHVAALAAYLRALPSKWQTQLRDPAALQNLIFGLSRPITPGGPRVVWNGQHFDRSCLLDANIPGCPMIPDNILSRKCNAENRVIASRAGPAAVRFSDFCWPAYQMPGASPGGGSGGGSGNGGALGGLNPAPVTWMPGTPQPTCAPIGRIGELDRSLGQRDDACGELCEGYYCVPQPNGHGPSYADPANAPPPPPPSSTTKKPATTKPATSKPPAPTTTNRFPVTSTKGNGEVIGCTDNKCTSTTVISPPTATPCVEFHCEVDDQRIRLDGTYLNAQVYEDGKRVCDTYWFISHDGPYDETITWGASGKETGGCLSDDYELSIFSECDSYTFKHKSIEFQTSFQKIMVKESKYSCDCMDWPNMPARIL